MDLPSEMILEEYKERLPIYQKMEKKIRSILEDCVRENGIYINALETRIKAEDSLAGKLELKGFKYKTSEDITDLVGARIITFYEDEVDKMAALVGKAFEVDWENSVDKRKMHELDSFGYGSLHYVCRIPYDLYHEDGCPEINRIRFEIQIRTALQHVWATINHDTGYKSGVEVPAHHIRNINRLAGMLELADEQFSRIRTEINDYRRHVKALVRDGNFDEVPLDVDSFRSYLEMNPFDDLTKKIAAINQAEILYTPILPYLPELKKMGFKTLGDIHKLVKENSEDAYQLAVYELGNTDIDIISCTLAVQNMLTVHFMKQGVDGKKLLEVFTDLNGPSPYNEERVKRIIANVSKFEFMNKKK